MSEQPKYIPRMLGLRNITCTKEDWHYLIFYDIDREITQQDIDMIDYFMQKYRISYLLYKTKHGHHIIGLTPLNAMRWAEIFIELKNMFKSYYSGNVIRLSRKKDEKQELVTLQEHNGEVIPNLYNLYASRFEFAKKPWIRETSKYLLVFEKYRSVKE